MIVFRFLFLPLAVLSLSLASDLPPLKPMAQSRRGVTEAQMHPLALAIPRFIQLMVPLI
jgi:hypothetical protein